MADHLAANDVDVLALDEAMVLVDEIDRLRTELAKCESRIAELDRLAHRDCLVDVPNRRCFLESLTQLIARRERYGGDAAVLFVDVDGLKAINDKFGHKAGDRALMQVAQMIVSTVRRSDWVGRLGGDEFGILLEQADELSAWQLALRIIETVDECHFCVGEVCLPLSVATGVASVRHGDTAESVLSRADKEMYRIKGIGAPPPGR